ncbi:MAG: DNA replication/repair protein RecF [Bacteroidetes bacterium]|nr:DNA replication/repair protein RecF [Bacteroidota bacterium]
MYLQKLSLLNFKNYEEADLSFSEDVNAFVGGNGEGKTNLLDAIHYLSMCKSYFNAVDTQNIRHDAEFFLVQGTFNHENREEHIYCGLKKNQRKIFKRNQEEYERLADHIGFLPVVMISPTDANLITEGSEERRKFIDSIISQFDKSYLDNLIQYNKVVSQRNALLKQFAQARRFDETSLEIWDEQMIVLGEKIYRKRLEFVNHFLPIFKNYYRFISHGREDVAVLYESHLHQGNFGDVLKAALDRDRSLQFSTVGIHKDDLVFTVDGYPVKRFASQGQQKSFLIALKLAQFDFVREVKKMKPILLLDDIFDKLDNFRVKNLMELVSKDNFGQIFITDAHPERVKKVFEEIQVEILTFEVSNGSVVQQRETATHSSE